MFVGVVAMMSAAPAFAADDNVAVEELVVTGSRIQRPNLESPTPLQVVTPDRMQAQGLANVSDILQTLPQFAPSFGGSRTQSTFSGTAASGLNVINLRNLGSTRSLVLINGRRAPSGTISSNAVDLNTLPSANISRIEVITGGSAAVYGADAVSGVVNIITDKKFEGFKAGLSYGEALKHHDNQNPNAYAQFGVNFDRGHAGVTVEYDYQGLVSCADRYLCSDDFAWFPPGDPQRGPAVRSSVTPTGRYFTPGGPAGSYTIINGQAVPFSLTAHGYNRNAQRTLAIPTERIMVAADADYKIAKGLNAFVEINYGSSETKGPFEAHPFQSSSDLVGGVLEPSIPVNNPFIPASLRSNLGPTQTTITWSQRLSALGNRSATNTRETARIAAGLTGEFDSIGGFGKDWHYEASYVWGRTTLDGQTNGLVSREALYQGLRVVADPTRPGQYMCENILARAQGCVPINPFDGYNDQEKAYLVRSGGVHSRSEIQNGLIYLSGSIYDLPAGPLGVVVGAETRRIVAYEDYSEDINRGITTGNQISDSDRTRFKTDEFFGEVTVPILADMTFAKELTFEGAYRWSDANVGGKYETWKYGGQWSPVAGLRFRAIKARAARAPTLGEVTGVGQTFGVVADPCINWGANSNATLRANCQAAGVPGNYNPPLSVQQSVSGFVGGNPDLKPERADTLTYGVVLQAGQFDFVPPALRDLSITVDRFQIKLDGLISTIGRQNLAQLCYTRPTGQREVFCSQITRATDPAVPGANYVLKAVDDQLQNIASLKLRGWDVEVNYNVDFGTLSSSMENWGSLTINSVWTFYDKAKQVPLPGDDPLNLLGAAGGSTSDQGWLKRQGNTTLTWTLGRLKTSWTARYIGAADSAPVDLFGEDAVVRIKSKLYNDASVRFKWTDSTEVYVGMRNIFNVKPPFFPTSQSGTQALDTVPAYYDIFGRSAFAGIRLRF